MSKFHKQVKDYHISYLHYLIGRDSPIRLDKDMACKCCGAFLGGWLQVRTNDNGVAFRYCPRCGQKIDRGDFHEQN